MDKKNVGLKEIQDNEYMVLLDLLNVFEKFKFKYYITGGSVLGVRYYNDFIPYDDDIDITMPRKDYNKLLSLADLGLNSKYKLKHYSKDGTFKYTIIRVENTEVDIYEVSDPNKHIAHPSIDIAPLDGVPSNKIVRKIFYLRLLILRAILSWYYSDTINLVKDRTLFQKIVIFALKKSSFAIKKINISKIKMKIDLLLSKYDFSSSELAGTYMGAYRSKEMIPTKFWGEGKKYKFRDVEVVGPSNIDGYINALYGGFKELSSEEAMKARHYVLIERKK